jgi:anti-anti-sigma factor
VEQAAETGGVLVVRVAGEIDVTTAWRFQNELSRASSRRPRTLIVDVSEVDFLGVEGIEYLLDAAMTLDADRRRLVVRRCTPVQRRVIHLVGDRYRPPTGRGSTERAWL